MHWGQWVLYTAVSLVAILVSTYLKERTKNRAYLRDLASIRRIVDKSREDTERRLDAFGVTLQAHLQRSVRMETRREDAATRYASMLDEAYWFLMLKAKSFDTEDDASAFLEGLFQMTKAVVSAYRELESLIRTDDARDVALQTAGHRALPIWQEAVTSLGTVASDLRIAAHQCHSLGTSITRNENVADRYSHSDPDVARRALQEIQTLLAKLDAATDHQLDVESQLAELAQSEASHLMTAGLEYRAQLQEWNNSFKFTEGPLPTP